MDKQVLRERIWDDLEERGLARFPYPPHGRIPNFAGAAEAAERLRQTPSWSRATVVKANPDAPQLPVRRAALRDGKTLYVAVPRLREPECFLRLDPQAVGNIEEATTIDGAAEAGRPVAPDDVDTVDMVVAGSVAVTRDGARVGKGEGYSDLEYAILAAFDRVGPSTTVATTVHDRQAVDESVPVAAHDVPLDLIATPERVIRTQTTAERPSSVDWEALDPDRIDDIPVLQQLRPEDR